MAFLERRGEAPPALLGGIRGGSHSTSSWTADLLHTCGSVQIVALRDDEVTASAVRTIDSITFSHPFSQTGSPYQGKLTATGAEPRSIVTRRACRLAGAVREVDFHTTLFLWHRSSCLLILPYIEQGSI